MELGDRLRSLLDWAEELGIDVRAEPLTGEGGGLCFLRGQRVLFVDTAADLATRYDRTLTALAGLDELDQHYLVPEIRQELEARRSGAEPSGG